MKAWAIATAAAVFGALPLIAYGIGERNQIGFLAQRTEVTPTTVFVTLWFGQPMFALIGWVFLMLGVAVVAVRWWRSRRHPTDPTGRRGDRLVPGAEYHLDRDESRDRGVHRPGI